MMMLSSHHLQNFVKIEIEKSQKKAVSHFPVVSLPGSKLHFVISLDPPHYPAVSLPGSSFSLSSLQIPLIIQQLVYLAAASVCRLSRSPSLSSSFCFFSRTFLSNTYNDGVKWKQGFKHLCKVCLAILEKTNDFQGK